MGNFDRNSHGLEKNQRQSENNSSCSLLGTTRMAVNLTPQYHAAEEEYKRAQTPKERLACLRKMYQLVPKHKASEKLQADLKTKIKETNEEVEKERKTGKKSGGPSYRIPKQGAGQYVFLGPPNSGKSRLISRLTSAKSEVASYAFTTRAPVVGMMDWEDVHVQLIDLPPVTADFLEPYVTSLTRAADAALLFLDLSDDDGTWATQAVIDRFAEHKTDLAGPAIVFDRPGFVVVPTLLVATKRLSHGAEDRLTIADEIFPDRAWRCSVDLEGDHGIDQLKELLFRFLNVIRVYTKEPGKPADKTAPFTCPVGSTVAEFAGCVHHDLAEKTKTARVWGSAAFDGQTVGRDHVLKDGDVVELHH
jgi:ribosome-interacting GTPase 1